MGIYLDDVVTNTSRSVYYFLNNQTYSGAGIGGRTLKSRFNDPGLNIVTGFPDALEKMDVPTIAIDSESTSRQEITFGSTIHEQNFDFVIHGFAGGHTSDNKNQLQRDQLMNDIIGILEETDKIDYYKDGSFTSADSDLVLGETITGRKIPPTSPLQAEKYRFEVGFTVQFIKSDG